MIKYKLLTYCILLLSFNAIAQQSEILDTALVSASRNQSSLKSANRNVIVLKGTEIENAPVQSISQLLDYATGIDARQRGTLGTQTDLSIRGSSFEQVAVLINGIRLNDPQTGHHLMNLPVDKDNIERIEILLGGGSYIFGGSAYGGAINIITKKATEDKFMVKATLGSHNSYELGATQIIVGKNNTTTISANHKTSDGFKTNTDFEILNLFVQSQWQTDNGQINFSSGYTQQGFGAQSFYSSTYPHQYEKTKTLMANLGYSSGDKIKINRSIYWRRNYDEFQLYREDSNFFVYNNGLFIMGNDTAASFYKNHNYHRTDVVGAKADIQFKSPLGNTNIGGELRLEDIVSNNLGEPLEGTVAIPRKRVPYHLGAHRYNASFAVEQSKSIQNWDLSVALLANYNTAYDLDFYPAATLGFNFLKNQKLYASFNRSFRLPSYTDLYYNLGGAVGSKSLVPENSLNYELGYKLLTKKWFFNLSIFRREGSNTIDWVQTCASCPLQATNTSVVNFNGADLNVRYQTNVLSIDYLELGYSKLFTDNENIAYQSLYVFDYLSNKISLRVQHTFFNAIKWSYALSFQDRNGQYVDATTGLSTDYVNVVLLSSRLSYTYKKAEVYLSAQNLLDKTYYDRGNVQLPGFWAWCGISFSL